VTRPSPAAPAPTATPSPATTKSSASATRQPSGDDIDDELVQENAARWVSMANVVGAALVVVVALQILAALVEGTTYETNQPQQVPTGDFLHRFGYPFGSLGTTTLIFLVIGVVLLSLPAYLGDETTPSQDRLASVALIVAVIAAVVLALGSLLAVRANFHVYNESQRDVPTYVVVQYASFMIGNLGTAVIAFYASMQVMSLRTRQ